MAEATNETFHPQSIKLPAAVEVFANLKNAQKFAIDIGELVFSFFSSTGTFARKLFLNVRPLIIAGFI